jgi:hemolysin activation/secretion protein
MTIHHQGGISGGGAEVQGLKRPAAFLPVLLPFLLPCLLTSLYPNPLSAAERPDAGTILEGIREMPRILPGKDAQPTMVEPEQKHPLDPEQTIRIKVNGFHITGSTVFGEGDLARLLAHETGRDMSFTDIEQAAYTITTYYRLHGYPVARAYLPPQEIADGLVKVAVVEGRIGAIEIRKDEDVRLSEAAVRRIVTEAVRPGSVVSQKAIERGVLLLHDLPGIEVKATLRPGTTPGITDLLLELTSMQPLTASVDFDNYGGRYTGYYRAGTTLSENGLAGLGESLNFRAMTAGAGLSYARASFAVPVGSSGTKTGVAYSQMDYKLGRDYDPLDAKGTAEVKSIYLTHPLQRSKQANIYGLVQYDEKDLVDRIDTYGEVTRKELHVGTFSLLADSIDGWLGGGINNVSLSAVVGSLDIGSQEARAADAASAKADGGYAKAVASISRLQRMTARFALYFSLSGQVASKNLDSSEKFLLGGPLGVRSYPVNEASGDEAYLATLELRYTVPERVERWIGATQLIGFFDAGRSWLNTEQWQGAGSENHRDLYGTGVGVNWSTSHFALRASYAWKIGTGKATCDTDRSGQFWLQAVAWY